MNSMNGSRGPAGSFSTRPAGGKDLVPKGYQKAQLAQFTPQQMELFKQLFQHLSPDSFLAQIAGGDESSFEQMEAPAWRLFQQAQGQLGSRFSDPGRAMNLGPRAMSAQRGSGFQNAAGQLGSDFAMNLASKRQELQRQAIMDLMGLSESLLGQRPYETGFAQKPQKQASSGLGGFGGLLGTGLGAAGGLLAGGPAGALAGASIGGRALSGF